MTTTATPGWYADPARPGMLRYWDGTAWTEHQTPGSTSARPAPAIHPGLVGVWISAILSLFTFYFRSLSSDGSRTTIAIPIGVISMIVCWSLVTQAARNARAMGIPLPGAYTAAKITAWVLAAIAVLGSVVSMVTGN